MNEIEHLNAREGRITGVGIGKTSMGGEAETVWKVEVLSWYAEL